MFFNKIFVETDDKENTTNLTEPGRIQVGTGLPQDFLWTSKFWTTSYVIQGYVYGWTLWLCLVERPNSLW